ncbi:Formyl transferase domain protein [Magnetospirillum sp. LM-5]|uniref:methionyl-tRNA formyltransferase n=1 Tax=Magnetospirillum sp. LM-5 TaxID=2681466 RepID=UPI0013861B85|nr:methionyl-tRNA formyltransferase [Magnetospirillum sp. LM-5]CAA7622585.1 Formyl transferase domain protein [Magnetospirillum sp. LM-5]
MSVAVFTSNQPRHLSLIRSLARVFDTVYAVMECNTVFPGQVADFFRKSEVMQDYFGRVMAAEDRVFGSVDFLPGNVRVLALKMGDASQVAPSVFAPVFEADHTVVFGASYLKGALCERLVERGALNIHMGVSPYYRGSSCNFWALADRRPDMVGATIHKLSKGLDSGAMYYHAFPKPQAADPFLWGMLSVKAAHDSLVEAMASGALSGMEPVEQDRTREMRYTRNADFTDEVAAAYLSDMPTATDVMSAAESRDTSLFLRPIFA